MMEKWKFNENDDQYCDDAPQNGKCCVINDKEIMSCTEGDPVDLEYGCSEVANSRAFACNVNDILYGSKLSKEAEALADSENCNIEWCSGEFDCFAGFGTDNCECSEGEPVMTGKELPNFSEGQTAFGYTCCNKNEYINYEYQKGLCGYASGSLDTTEIIILSVSVGVAVVLACMLILLKKCLDKKGEYNRSIRNLNTIKNVVNDDCL